MTICGYRAPLLFTRVLFAPVLCAPVLCAPVLRVPVLCAGFRVAARGQG
jgi:hypothetical protein